MKSRLFEGHRHRTPNPTSNVPNTCRSPNTNINKEFYGIAAAKHLKRLETEGTAHSMSNALWAFAIAGRVKENKAKITSLWQKVMSMDEADFYEEDWKVRNYESKELTA